MRLPFCSFTLLLASPLLLLACKSDSAKTAHDAGPGIVDSGTHDAATAMHDSGQPNEKDAAVVWTHKG